MHFDLFVTSKIDHLFCFFLVNVVLTVLEYITRYTAVCNVNTVLLVKLKDVHTCAYMYIHVCALYSLFSHIFAYTSILYTCTCLTLVV